MRRKLYRFYEYPDGEVIMTNQQILSYYWKYWKGKMLEVGKDDLICKKNCIEDFCIINWATEIKHD